MNLGKPRFNSGQLQRCVLSVGGLGSWASGPTSILTSLRSLILIVVIVVVIIVVVIVVDIVADGVDDVECGVGRDEEEGGKVEGLGDPGTSFLFSQRGGPITLEVS